MTDIEASPGPLIAQASPRPQDLLSPCLWPSIALCKGIVAGKIVCKPSGPVFSPVSSSVFMGATSHR